MQLVVQAAEIFGGKATRESVGKALELVDSVVSVTADGINSDELSVTTDLLRNTTSLLLDFQKEGEEIIMVNEVWYLLNLTCSLSLSLVPRPLLQSSLLPPLPPPPYLPPCLFPPLLFGLSSCPFPPLRHPIPFLLNRTLSTSDSDIILQSLVIVTVLDNILDAPPKGEVENDDVGVAVVTSSENYGKFLLGSHENLTLGMGNIGQYHKWGDPGGDKEPSLPRSPPLP